MEKLDFQHVPVLAALKLDKSGVEKSYKSLFNAVSLALWGVHDRTDAVEAAVMNTLYNKTVSWPASCLTTPRHSPPTEQNRRHITSTTALSCGFTRRLRAM